MPAPLTFADKLTKVKRVEAALSTASSLREACRLANVPFGSFMDWKRKMEAKGGHEGLMADYSNCGRPPKFELTPEEQTALRSYVLVFDSQAFAIEEFARKHPECRPQTAAAILDEMDKAAKERRYCRWPISLRQAACVTLEERAALRGGKALDAISFSPRKGMFIELANGEKITLHPHTAWTMDDYSTNQPYIISGENDEQERVCRQVLAAMDVASDAWLSVEMIGRERDAYRAEDIVRFILRTIDAAQTMPLYLLLERGRWDSAGVHGLDLGKEIGPKYAGRTWGGLDHLFTIIHGFSSRHKAMLESSFNILQRALAHSGTDIGRKRGEFEKATRSYLAVQAGRQDPHAAGYLTMDQAREAHWRAMQLLNERGKHRAATGTVEIPNDLLGMFAEADSRPLPDSERWRFLPIKRRATVRGGFVEMSVQPYRQPFRFQVCGLSNGFNLATGHTLLVAFDPAMPAMGAYVANGETGTQNREGWNLGQFLFTAPNAQDVPMFSLMKGGYKNSGKRAASVAARTAFAGINPLGKRGLAVTSQHDGAGNANISRTGVSKATDGLTGHIEGEPTPALAGTRNHAPEPDTSLLPTTTRQRRIATPVLTTEQAQRLTEEAMAALDGL